MIGILAELNKRFDHAALRPETTEKDIIRLCSEAVEYKLFAIAVNPVWVPIAKDILLGSGVRIVSVAGFPLGANRTESKIVEAVRCANDGAHEIDMVANIGWLISGEPGRAREEISSVRKKLPYNVLLKVIVEAGLLTPPQQIDAVRAVINGGAQFVKTSTGFFGNTTREQIETLSAAAGGQVEVKASGGIRTMEQCRVMLEAGATRLGSSASVSIMREYLKSRGDWTPDGKGRKQPD